MSGKKTFDIVFVTHLPAFYKVNLYREVAKHCRIFVIFIASESVIRTQDFSIQDCDFPHAVLYQGAFERRPLLKTCYRMLGYLRRLNAEQFIVGGWDLPEFWMPILLKGRIFNSVAVESTCLPAPFWKKYLKKCFLSRVARSFVSGRAQADLLNGLNFSGKLHYTGGVGLFHWKIFPPKEDREIIRNFVFVGRYAPEKNLGLLMRAFQARPNLQLTCIGAGPEEAELKEQASENIRFLPPVPHENLSLLLCEQDVLILPSKQEAWGLVIEEAQHCQLPVIISSAVGCAYERVIQPQAGLVFQTCNLDSLLESLDRMTDLQEYQRCQKGLAAMPLKNFSTQQVESYLSI